MLEGYAIFEHNYDFKSSFIHIMTPCIFSQPLALSALTVNI